MGSVVWLMYLADLTGSLSGLLIGLGFAGTLGSGLYRLGVFMHNDTTYGGEKITPRPVRKFIVGGCIAFALAALLPSQNTIYAVAAVAAGDKALNTPTGDKAIRALNAWLDRQIANDPNKKN